MKQLHKNDAFGCFFAPKIDGMYDNEWHVKTLQNIVALVNLLEPL